MTDNTPSIDNPQPQVATLPAQKGWWESDVGGGIGCVTLIFIGVIFMLYQADWSGLKGKNVWDWFELIIVPLVLAGGGFFLQRTEADRIKRQEALEKERIQAQQVLEKERIEAQAERERQQAKDSLMNSIFQGYLDDMSALMINNQLQTMLDIVTADRLRKEAEEAAAAEAHEETAENTDSTPTTDSEQITIPIDKSELAQATAIVTVARARTVTAFRTLDVARRNLLANFLRETDLVTGEHGTLLVDIQLPNVDLSETDLTGMNLSQANLEKANLSHACLDQANLSHACLDQADLSHADLTSANLNYAYLWQANLSYADSSGSRQMEKRLESVRIPLDLSHADLREANLSHTNLMSANLSYAYLGGANLSHVNLVRAYLMYAYLNDANLSHAALWRVNLSHAYLRRANLSHADLNAAYLSHADLNAVNLRDTILEAAQFDNKTILPDAEVWNEKLEEYTYDKCWSEATDMARYTNPEHPDFWEPPYFKAGYEGETPRWVTEMADDENESARGARG